LYFFPEPQGQASFRPVSVTRVRAVSWSIASLVLAALSLCFVVVEDLADMVGGR
jgi:hypothetical protein